MSVDDIIVLNQARLNQISAPFDPLTGLGSVGERRELFIPDFIIPRQFVPLQMLNSRLARLLIRHGSIDEFIRAVLKVEPSDEVRSKVRQAIIRLRYLHDFPFWAASCAYIKNKGGGDDVLFRLSRPQRKFVALLEEMRTNGLPIRVILLKARQWGGSTTSQLYMAWLQLVHKKGLNSLIIAHVLDGSVEIRDMFNRMMNAYPLELLHPQGVEFNIKEQKLIGVDGSNNIKRIPQRNCKIKIGTAEKPDSCRGGDYSLVHLSEVGVWKKTEGKSPEDIVQSACSGILLKPLTMIVYESTANGTGNFFQREYDAAKNGYSQFKPLFISWFDIDQYSIPFPSHEERRLFATALLNGRCSTSPRSSREESGQYLWWLWQKGATLEAINWYIQERRGKNDHGVMASEYPSDDIEAFVHSGSMVFDRYRVEALRAACRPPALRGEVAARSDEGEEALQDIRFAPDAQGALAVWNLPETDDADDFISDRYICIVDIGGRGSNADWSVIAVFDRIDMLDPSGRPFLVAQWRGHTDMDILAWKAAQIANFYNQALLVIESNTIETHDRERHIEGGDQSLFLLNRIRDFYPNLYARRQSEDEIRQGLPRKYGFHTNIKTKPLIISSLIKIVRDGLYIERDENCLDELLSYERKPNGAYGAIAGKHDDILMTRAIGLHICFYEMPLPQIIKKEQRHQRRSRPSSEAVF